MVPPSLPQYSRPGDTYHKFATNVGLYNRLTRQTMAYKQAHYSRDAQSSSSFGTGVGVDWHHHPLPLANNPRHQNRLRRRSEEAFGVALAKMSCAQAQAQAQAQRQRQRRCLWRDCLREAPTGNKLNLY